MWPHYLQPQIHLQDSYSINWPLLHYRSLTQQFQAELVVKPFSFSAWTLTTEKQTTKFRLQIFKKF